MDAIPPGLDASARREHFALLQAEIFALLEDQPDWISAMATVACELHQAHTHYHWTGFYRLVEPQLLRVGPYQGGHGCLEIALDRGVCGAAARTKQSQLVADVNAFAGHIACSSSTRSELVVPVLTPSGEVLAVLDIDSDLPEIFDELDRELIESLCAALGERYAGTTQR